MAGIGAAGLQRPFFNGSLRMSRLAYAIAPGLIFAISMTLSAVLLANDRAPRGPLIRRYGFGAVVLAQWFWRSGLGTWNGSCTVCRWCVANRDRPHSTGRHIPAGRDCVPFFLGEI